MSEIKIVDQENYQSVRFSFSRFNTKEDVEFTLQKIKDIINHGK